jgi:hypothetical protein
MSVAEIVISLEDHKVQRLETALHNKEMQLDRVVETAVQQQVFAWLADLDTSPSQEQIDQKTNEVRAWWRGVALSATARRGGTR